MLRTTYSPGAWGDIPTKIAFLRGPLSPQDDKKFLQNFFVINKQDFTGLPRFARNDKRNKLFIHQPLTTKKIPRVGDFYGHAPYDVATGRFSEHILPLN